MRIGLISSPVPGHINPMSTLGRELKRRGHETFFFNIEDTRHKITAEGHEFVPIGADEFGVGAWEKCWVPLSQSHGLPVVLKTIKLHTRLSRMMVREIPPLAKELRLDGLLIDQVQFQGKAVAALAGLPFISVACALHMDVDRNHCAPPAVSARRYGTDAPTRLLNRLEAAIMQKAAAPLIGAGNPALKSLGLPPCRTADESYSTLAQIFPMPQGGDFPGDWASDCIHYVGAFIDQDRPKTDFPWDKLDGRPLIYASLGTLQNGMHHVYGTIAEACAGLDAQVVIALGQWRAGSPLPFTPPANALVVGYAPQLDLLARASLVITHAGMNTAYEALSFGLPMVALPITNDQPAVARRLERVGVAEVVPIGKLTAPRLGAAVQKVLQDPAYRGRAQALAVEDRAAGGVKRAADIVEEKLVSRG